MIPGGPFRSGKATVLIIGTVVFLAAFVGLVYNHLDAWELPTKAIPPPVIEHTKEKVEEKPAPIVPKPSSERPSELDTPVVPVSDDHLDFYIKQLFKPSITPTTKEYKPFSAFKWELPSEPKWTEPAGKNLCIIDLDNRAWNDPNQIFSEDGMNWEGGNVHGLSLGVLNHWLYAKIHGYKYYYVSIDTFEDRRASWKKPPIMAEILKDHDACIYLDSDAIFHHLDLPFEWLMNYWELNNGNNSLALALDPNSDNNKDKFGKVYLNTGFIIAQNNPKTYEIFDAWSACPEEDGPHPECVEFRSNRPGKPTDQGGFGTFTRYDFPNDIRELPCTEANGFPESKSGCNGIFIKHLWTGKSDWIKIVIGQQLPGAFLPIAHKQFLKERETFMITEAELLGGAKKN